MCVAVYSIAADQDEAPIARELGVKVAPLSHHLDTTVGRPGGLATGDLHRKIEHDIQTVYFLWTVLKCSGVTKNVLCLFGKNS